MQETGVREVRRAAASDTALVVLAASLRFLVGLGDEALRNWDEGLYCAATRDMLVERNPLFPISNGAFDAYYGKPPLLNWLHFLTTSTMGFSSFALRLPSALASILVVVLAHRVATRMAGRAAGAFAAAMLLVSLPFAELGRQSLLEPLLALFALFALHLHASSIERESTRLSFLAGVVTGLSVLTKQLVGALPLCAVIVAEIVLRRRGGLRRTLAHLAALLATSAWWFLWVRSIVGPELEESFVQTHLFERAAGQFERHGRAPGDYAQHLSLFFWTVPIVAGGVGALRAILSRETRVHGVLLGAFAFGHYLVFGVISKNFLPWYVFSAVPIFSVLAAVLFGRGDLWLRALLLGAVGVGLAMDAGSDPVAFGLVGALAALPFEWRPRRDAAPTLMLALALYISVVALPPRVVREAPTALIASLDAEETLVLLESWKQFVWKCYAPGASFAVVNRDCVDVRRAVSEADRDVVLIAPGLERCELHQRGYYRAEFHDGYQVYRRAE